MPIPTTQEETLANFTSQYPEAGEIRQGTRLSAESALAFGGIMASKILALSRETVITPDQATFIDTTLNLSARTLGWMYEHGAVASDTPTARQVCRYLGILQKKPLEPSDLPMALPYVADGSSPEYSMRETPYARANVEDAAMNIMHLFGETVAAAGGVSVDEYMAGNLRAMIGYEEQAGI